MNIKTLKNQIENNTVGNSPIVFLNSENSFLSNQYVMEIARARGLSVVYTDEIHEDSSADFLFEDDTSNDIYLTVMKVDELNTTSFTHTENLVIVTNKIDKEIFDDIKEYVVEMPKLAEWQIKDFVFSLCDGADSKDIEEFMSLVGKDIFRIESEATKVSIFREQERKFLMKDLLMEGNLSETTNYVVFNFTNALIKRDSAVVGKIMRDLDKMGVTNFGLLALMLKNLRNMILVKEVPNPVPEKTGLDEKQIYAIKKIVTPMSNFQLVELYKILLDIDRQVKCGEMPAELMIDYIVIKTLTV